MCFGYVLYIFLSKLVDEDLERSFEQRNRTGRVAQEVIEPGEVVQQAGGSRAVAELFEELTRALRVCSRPHPATLTLCDE